MRFMSTHFTLLRPRSILDTVDEFRLVRLSFLQQFLHALGVDDGISR